MSLVMRFESSKSAFKSTLESILNSYENIKKWWDKGYVPIKKSGYLPDPDEEEIQETLDEINSIAEEGIDLNKIKKKAIPFEKALFRPEFNNAMYIDIDSGYFEDKSKSLVMDNLFDTEELVKVSEALKKIV